MENNLPTCGQLERQLCQTLQAIYRQKFGHSVRKVTCNLFADQLAIVAEDTVTTIEKILLDNSQSDLADSLRREIIKIFETQIKQTVANILQVEVIDLVSGSTLDSGRIGVIVFLNNVPQTRLTKARCTHQSDRSFSLPKIQEAIASE